MYSEDADQRLVSKRTWAKNWFIGLSPRARFTRYKCDKMPLIWRHSKKTPSSKQNIFLNLQ